MPEFLSYYTTRGPREKNEDSVAVMRVAGGIADIKMVHDDEPDDYNAMSKLPNGTLLMVVADGMGGLKSGEVASYMTLSEIIDRLNNLPAERIDMTSVFREVTAAVSKTVRLSVHGNGGSTLVGALIIGCTCWVFSVGDSRCHVSTVLGDWTSKPHVFSADGEGSNMITDFMGMEEDPDVRVEVFGQVRGVVMGSDGLDPGVESLKRGIYSVSSAKELCEASLRCGSTDNTTAIVYRSGL